MVVLQTLPEHHRAKCLSVVHITFAGIVTKNAIDHDLLLAFVEPSILAAELRSCLCRRRREVEPGDDSDNSSQAALEGEQPSPS